MYTSFVFKVMDLSINHVINEIREDENSFCEISHAAKLLVEEITSESSRYLEVESMLSSLLTSASPPEVTSAVPLLCKYLAHLPTLSNRASLLQTKLDETCSKLQITNSNLEVLCAQVKSDLSAVKTDVTEVKKDLTNVKSELKEVSAEAQHGSQYSRRPSLVFHGLYNIPVRKKGTAFSKYATAQTNKLLPNLPDRVSYRDIHASHP